MIQPYKDMLRQAETDLDAARAEIERLTAERNEAAMLLSLHMKRAEKAEAKRDEARAQVGAVVVGLKSLVSVVQGYQQMPGFSLHPMVAAQIDSLAQTSISDYKSALEAYGLEKVREGMQRASEVAADRCAACGVMEIAGLVKAHILADMEKLK